MRRPGRRLGTLLLAPALAVLAPVTLYPLLAVLALSLERRVPVFGIREFVGLANYAFLAGDPAFWNALRVTLLFAGASVTLEALLGLGADRRIVGVIYVGYPVDLPQKRRTPAAERTVWL